MFFKKNKLIILGIVLAFGLLAGCGQKESTDIPGNSPTSNNSDEVISVIFSHNAPPGNPIDRAFENFKKEVEEKSEGRLNIQLFGNHQLGSQREQAEQVQTGDIQMTAQATSVLSPFTEHIEILDLPFLWPGGEEMIDMLQGEIEDELLGTLSAAGFKGLSIVPYSSKHFTNNVHPINGPEDLKGLKMRTQGSQLLIKQFELWGANPTPIDLSEIYNSLQTGVVVGQDNGLDTIYTQNFHEVQKYLTLSGHNTMSYIFFANEKWFNNLPEDLQEIIESASKNAAIVYNEIREKEEAEILQKIIDSGVEVNELSKEALQEFMELSQPLYDEFIKTDIQKNIYNKIKDQLK